MILNLKLFHSYEYKGYSHLQCYSLLFLVHYILVVGLLVSIWIPIIMRLRLRFFFFFLEAHFVAVVFFQWVLCTVHGTHKPLFSTKLSLKIGHTALFTHLKIILLQYFQFSVLSKISGIQTHP